jgi:hypothetical protein
MLPSRQHLEGGSWSGQKAVANPHSIVTSKVMSSGVRGDLNLSCRQRPSQSRVPLLNEGRWYPLRASGPRPGYVKLTAW